MLLNFTELCRKYNIKSTGVIAVGAHFGEEYDEYVSNGIEHIVFIEPCEKAFSVLRDRFHSNHKVMKIKAACSDYAGKAIMFTGDNTINKGQSNSLLKPDKHLFLHPEVEFDRTEEVRVETLSNLVAMIKPAAWGGYKWIEGCKLLVMDTQGTEGRVIKGAMEILGYFDYIYTEINFDSVYENCTLADELDSLLHDFERVETGAKVGGMWSDSLYIRKSLLS